MGKIVTSAIHKGGTGKTTIAVALTFYARALGLSVCLVDLDPQGNASKTWVTNGESAKESERASKLFVDVGLKQPFVSKEGINVISADHDLLAIERLPLSAVSVFKKRVQEHAKHYDLVIIDTPPTMGFAMLAPLTASDFVFSPIIPDAYGIDGVASLFSKVRAVQSKDNKDLKFLGLLINRWNRRNKDQDKIVEALQKKLGKNVMPHTIGDRASIANAAHRKLPVWKGVTGGAAKVASAEMRRALGFIIKQMNVSEK